MLRCARGSVLLLRGARLGPGAALSRRLLSGSGHRERIVAPPMVYIKGEEMTRYTMQLILDQWIAPHVDTSAWEFYDLSCKARDDSEDKVLHDAVAAGQRLKAIFKEPTVTPTEVQKQQMGLKKTWGSPNGAMRRGWNGITISRDTIMIEGMKLGYAEPVLFERHAVGGEYGAGYKTVGRGQLKTLFWPEGADTSDMSQAQLVDSRQLKDSASAVVTYDNPLDNVTDLAHIFFTRCLTARVTPYVVTKKTVFKWQEGFWTRMKSVFEKHYKTRFQEARLLDETGGELMHLISDAATMQLIRWKKGGFGMAAHNYDGDMLTDELAQIHRSPGFITSNLTGKAADGTMIKEFEASHGTVSDMWLDHEDGEETSMNPLGLVEALIGAMRHSAAICDSPQEAAVHQFTEDMRSAIHRAFVAKKGTRDISGEKGLTTELFIGLVGRVLAGEQGLLPDAAEGRPVAPLKSPSFDAADQERMDELFSEYDANGDGYIERDEFVAACIRTNNFPKKFFPEGRPKF